MEKRHDGTWITGFPHFHGLASPLAERIVGPSRRAWIRANSTIFEPREACTHYILVRSGSIRVGLIDGHGHEIVLYRLGAGDSCVLTTATLLADSFYTARAVAETAVDAVMLPKAAFLRLLAEADSFRQAVPQDHSKRLLDLMVVIGRIAFESIDFRLVQTLQALAAGRSEIRITHQALAVELGTAREVVSRRLKQLERSGWLSLHKGRI